MAESPRYTVRLPHDLDAEVQARVRAGTPFAVLIRETLKAYLATTPPTAADPADTVRTMQEQLAALTSRIEIVEQELARRRQPRRQPVSAMPTEADIPADTTPTLADSRADRAPTPADTTRGRQARGGRFKLTELQIAELRGKRSAGVPIRELVQEYKVSRATLMRYLHEH